jgi:hypothetical protein
MEDDFPACALPSSLPADIRGKDYRRRRLRVFSAGPAFDGPNDAHIVSFEAAAVGALRAAGWIYLSAPLSGGGAQLLRPRYLDHLGRC